MNSQIFIAEIKPENKSAFSYEKGKLTDLALEYGNWVSVHTDPRFGGSFDDIYQIRKETQKPILAKGLHCHLDDIKRAFDYGADYVLTCRAINVYEENKTNISISNVLFELSYEDLAIQQSYYRSSLRYDGKYLKFVFNGRDLKTGLGKKSLHQYFNFREKASWLCGASLIKNKRDLQFLYPDCDAFIVGTHLESFIKSLKK